jgi:hypothetical protein
LLAARPAISEAHRFAQLQDWVKQQPTVFGGRENPCRHERLFQSGKVLLAYDIKYGPQR